MDPAFAGQDLAGLRLIETLRREPDGTFPHLALHLERMTGAAARLGWRCDPAALRRALAGVPPGGGVRRVRLTLDASGQILLQHADCPPNPSLWRIALAGSRLDSRDPWLGVKSTRRALYDQTRADLPAGIDEMLFLNERDELCEGTITNLFIRRGDRLLTPPLRSGLLPGVLRRSLLETGAASEQILVAADLRDAAAIFMGNALRGLIPAELAP